VIGLALVPLFLVVASSAQFTQNLVNLKVKRAEKCKFCQPTTNDNDSMEQQTFKNVNNGALSPTRWCYQSKV